MYPQGVCRIRKPACAGNGCARFPVFDTEEWAKKDPLTVVDDLFRDSLTILLFYWRNEIMLYPPVADLLKKVDSRYLLVNLVAHRARQIAAEAEAFQEDLPEKPVTMAIEEVADGELSATVKEEYMK